MLLVFDMWKSHSESFCLNNCSSYIVFESDKLTLLVKQFPSLLARVLNCNSGIFCFILLSVSVCWQLLLLQIYQISVFTSLCIFCLNVTLLFPLHNVLIITHSIECPESVCKTLIRSQNEHRCLTIILL